MSYLTPFAVLLSLGTVLSSCPGYDWLPMTDGDCYLPLVPPFTTMDADESVQTCRFHGSDVTLPQVYSHIGQERVHLLTGGNYAWLSLRRANRSSPWLWPGGVPVSYTHWKTGNPTDTDEDCVVMNRDGFWENVKCDYPSYFAICYFRLS